MGTLGSLRAARKTLREVQRALDAGQWEQALDLGQPLLEDRDVPDEAGALLALALGQAQFATGHHAAASELLERGLAGVPRRRRGNPDLHHFRYWAGVAAMILGHMEQAREHLVVAAEATDRQARPSVVRGARRSLAELESERGNLAGARRILDAILLEDEHDDMCRVLRASVHQRAGRADEARADLIRVARATGRRAGNQGEAAELAATMITAAEVHVELGHPDEADAALEQAQQRLVDVQSINVHEAQMVPILRSAVARLRGDLDNADRFLAASRDTDRHSGQQRAAWARAAARLARARGDTDSAARHYDTAARTYEDAGLLHQARRTRREAEAGEG